MEQLDLRFYPREEISKVLHVRLDSKNFGRDIENKLSRAGYGCRYIKRKGVLILSKPETPNERLTEILYLGLGISIQINAEQFACFIAAFTDIDGFDDMPWNKRLKLYNEYYGYHFSQDRTLRSWCSQLLEKGVSKSNGEALETVLLRYFRFCRLTVRLFTLPPTGAKTVFRNEILFS